MPKNVLALAIRSVDTAENEPFKVFTKWDTKQELHPSFWSSCVLIGAFSAGHRIPALHGRRLLEHLHARDGGSVLGLLLVEREGGHAEIGASMCFSRSRRAAAGRAQLLAKGQQTDRLQIPAQLRRFGIGQDRAGYAGFQRGNRKFCEISVKFRRNFGEISPKCSII